MEYGYGNGKYLHGDVQIIARKAPTGAVIDSTKTDRCLAYGEVTGHAHRVSSGAVDFLKIGAETWLRVKETATITHEEHKPIVLPPGDYQYGITEEFNYDEMESRRVAD